jgi:hypothetical protein
VYLGWFVWPMHTQTHTEQQPGQTTNLVSVEISKQIKHWSLGWLECSLTIQMWDKCVDLIAREMAHDKKVFIENGT